jgi:hypothetical protein
MVVYHISEADFLFLGLDFAGYKGQRKNRSAKTTSQRFRSNFGIDPISCSEIFVDMQKEDDGLERPSVKYFFMTLAWLNCYETEAKMTGPWAFDDTTIRKVVFEYAKKISALATEKVSNPFLCPLMILHHINILFYYLFDYRLSFPPLTTLQRTGMKSLSFRWMVRTVEFLSLGLFRAPNGIPTSSTKRLSLTNLV